MTSDAIDTRQRKANGQHPVRKSLGEEAVCSRNRNSHRVWSLRKRAAPSSGLLETLPMMERVKGKEPLPELGHS